MFVKLTGAGGHAYAQLVKSFRDEHGKPRQRTVATLGRGDESGGQVDALLNGLLHSKGRPAASSTAPQLRFESALALGDLGRFTSCCTNCALTGWPLCSSVPDSPRRSSRRCV